jgi:hypothetical protein
MAIGIGNLNFTEPPGSGSGGGPGSAGARNGLSVDTGNFDVLGQATGAGSDPSEFLNDRQIPFNGHHLDLVDLLTTSPVQSHVMFWDGFPEDIQQNGDGTTTQDGNGGYILSFTPVNYGITYPSNYTPSTSITMNRWTFGYSLQNSNDNSGITGMPDAVLNFGYNIQPNAARSTTTDAAWRFGFETHFINDLQGHPESNFEFHLPEVTLYDGTIYRINSFYTDKTNAYTLNARTVNDTMFYGYAENVGHQDTPYLEFVREASGGGINFYQADSTGQYVGVVDWIGGFGSPGTRMASFGDGDWAVVDLINVRSQQILTNGDFLLNQQQGTAYPAQSAGVVVVGNVSTFSYSRGAQFSVYSTTRGSIPAPVMTGAQKFGILLTTEGLNVYDHDNQSPSFFDGLRDIWVNWGESRETTFTPLTGDTITLVRGQMNIINPAAGIATLNINLPTGVSSLDFIEVKFTQAVGAITWGGVAPVDQIPSATPGLYTKFVWSAPNWF